MADILKVTTPMPGQEQLGRVKPHTPSDPHIQNIPDPTRVTKPNQQNVYSDRQPEKFSPNLRSNFERFLRMLRGTPDLTESLGKIFFTKYGSIVQSGMNEGIAEELSTYMNMIKMTEGELAGMLKEGQPAANKFNGIFFDILRFTMKGDASGDLKAAVVDFLKKFDSLTGGGHILKNMVANLENIALRMPESYRGPLDGLIRSLAQGGENGQIHENVQILKNEIIPFISNYISKTKDFGPLRDFVNLLVLNLARYEMGAKENFVQSFRTLASFQDIQNQLEGIPRDELERFLMRQRPPEAGGGTIDKLVQLITSGVKGEAGYENKLIFQNILQSVLINESVYMPLVHMMIPADINGNVLFSELWIDPDDGGEGSGGGEGSAVKMFVKFDIKDLGYFEMVLLSQNDKVDMQLFYPEKLQHMKDIIGEGLSGIMEKNGLSFKSLALGTCIEPKPVSEVFPKIYEGRNVVNVAV